MCLSKQEFLEMFFFCVTTIYVVWTTARYNQNIRPVDSTDCALKIQMPPVLLRTISKSWPIFNNNAQLITIPASDSCGPFHSWTMASRTPPAALIDQNIAERFLIHLSGTGQAAHTAIAAATQHCEHAAIIRTVAYSGVFLIYDWFMTVAFKINTIKL